MTKRFPETILLIAGDGPEKNKIKKQISELDINKNVIFAGKISNKDLPPYYATADVFVGPSIITKKGDTEGLGVVFLEALASGTCVIGSNVGGIPDIIKNNKTGLLVKEKNSKELGEAIIKVLSDAKLRFKLAKQGHNYVKDRFSWKNVSKKFNGIIREIR